MARMIPNQGPSPTGSLVAEPMLYALFKSKLSNDFTVIHSLPWLAKAAAEIDGRNVPTGELDFLILHPKFGILGIEVKGGRVGYDRKSFVILRSGERIDPVLQVRRSIHALAPWLASAGGPKRRIGYALAFPESVMNGQPLPPSLVDLANGDIQNICIDQTHLANLAERITKIMQYWNDSLGGWSLTKDQIETIVEILCPIADYSPRWQYRIAEDAKRWLILTSEQAAVLESTKSQQHVVLNGRSGTGKTILAIAHTQQMVSKNLKVLFLVYNVLLAKRLRREIQNTNVTVVNFHELCRIASTALGLSSDDTQEWFLELAPAALRKAIQQDALPNFDGLVIDEAQVFQKEWLTDLAIWFKEKPIFSCCDETQVFDFENATTSEEIAKIIGTPVPFVLTVNLRSPKKVFDRLRTALPPTNYQQISLRPDDNDTLQEIVTPDPQKALEEVIQDLNEQGVPREAITVVYTAAERQPRIRPHITKMIGLSVPVLRYRGLESPIVIVYAGDDWIIDDIRLSCAYARATSRCIAIFKATSFISTNQSKFTSLVLKDNSVAVEQLNSFWPPKNSLGLFEIVSGSVEISWSHYLKAWIFLRSANENRLAMHLWRLHLAYVSDNPSIFINDYFPIEDGGLSLPAEMMKTARKLKEKPDVTNPRIFWHDNCKKWTRISEKDASVVPDEDCPVCTSMISETIPESAAALKIHDAILSNPTNYQSKDKQQLSVFLIALGRFRNMKPEVQSEIQRYINLYGRPSYSVAKLLTGISIYNATINQEIKLETLSKQYWDFCPWLATHTDVGYWRSLIAQSLNGWLTHEWIKKTSEGIYTRIELPEFIEVVDSINEDQ